MFIYKQKIEMRLFGSAGESHLFSFLFPVKYVFTNIF